MGNVKYGLMVLGLTLAPAGVGYGKSTLFEFQGKKYSLQDLNAKEKMGLHELDEAHYEGYKRQINDAVLRLHLEREAKRTKTSVEAVEKKLFSGSELSAKELKEFYDQNKARIRQPYEKVKEDIKHYLEAQRRGKLQAEVLESIKAKGGFALKLKKADAPTIDINTEGFPFKGNLES